MLYSTLLKRTIPQSPVYMLIKSNLLLLKVPHPEISGQLPRLRERLFMHRAVDWSRGYLAAASPSLPATEQHYSML
jgi:hypothetical protein